MMQIDPRPQRGLWMDDSSSSVCILCKAEFTLLIRRHHCRRCGGLFCNSCSSYWLKIPEEMMIASGSTSTDNSARSRCCSNCAGDLTNLANQQEQLAERARDVATSNVSLPSVHESRRSTLSPAIISSEIDQLSSQLLLSPCQSSSVSVSGTVPRRSVVDNTEAEAATIPPLPLPIVNCQEWESCCIRTVKYKLYSVTAPSFISHSRCFQVSLDDRIMNVLLPGSIEPGQRIMIKAPAPPPIVHRALAFAVHPVTKKVTITLFYLFLSSSNRFS